jgi:ABC-type Fe3+ transport system permease subunit
MGELTQVPVGGPAGARHAGAVAAWIVLLQREALVNKLLLALSVVARPLELLFNRTGVIVAMTHILLPFMILPLYSVMKSVPPTCLRAAVSLGSALRRAAGSRPRRRADFGIHLMS